MARYCVEFDADATNFIVHNQSCSSYFDIQLLIFGRITDIGEFSDARHALDHARQDYPNAAPCARCCHRSLRSELAA